MSHLYNIYHCYDVDGGFGDAVPQREHVALVEATEEEIIEFLNHWDRPRVYDIPYAKLKEHHVEAEIVKIQELKDVQPYDPKTRMWPDYTKDIPWGYVYNEKTEKWEWEEFE